MAEARDVVIAEVLEEVVASAAAAAAAVINHNHHAVEEEEQCEERHNPFDDDFSFAVDDGASPSVEALVAVQHELELENKVRRATTNKSQHA